ncbi:MAG: TolC family protein [Aquificaceae bacterium]|nr:TolC family protein [Aquificaceae bacterium]MCX8060764.1 TolC family protein [Aquificaceae bacterium]MDW8097614.1 TolC family protein [Aquificaceae bacterium]
MTHALFLLLLLLSGSLGGEILRLDPKSVYELALKNNKEIQKLEHQIKALEVDQQLAQRYYLPVVYAGASLLYDLDKRETRTNTNITVVSLLYEFQKVRTRSELSRIRKEVAQIMLRQLHLDLQLRIVKLFTEAHLYRKLAEVKREEMAIAYVRFDRARERKELGLSTDHEVYRLESLYREKRRELLHAQQMYNHALLETKQLAGLPYETLIELSELNFREPSVEFTLLKDSALRENSSLKIKELEIKSYEEDIMAVKQVLKPRVNLRLSTNGSGVEVSIPVYDASRHYRLEYLTSLKNSLQAEKEGIRRSVELIFFSAPYEWEYLKASLAEALAKDRFAEENLTLRRSEYELELAFDLGYAMAEKTEAERRLMEARYKLLLFWAKLFSLAGREPFTLLE